MTHHPKEVFEQIGGFHHVPQCSPLLKIVPSSPSTTVVGSGEELRCGPTGEHAFGLMVGQVWAGGKACSRNAHHPNKNTQDTHVCWDVCVMCFAHFVRHVFESEQWHDTMSLGTSIYIHAYRERERETCFRLRFDELDNIGPSRPRR